MPRVVLDVDYPNLSATVRDVLSLTLDQLAGRCPCDRADFYFDLERLLAAVRDSPLFNHPDFTNHGDNWAMVRGYLATFDAFLGLRIVKDPALFIIKKLLAPRVPRLPPRMPAGSEMLDSLAECSWGLWLHDTYGNLEETKMFPGGVGDADFFVDTPDGPLWIDCISLSSETPRDDMMKYLAPRVRTKWRDKFGARSGAANLPAAIAVTLLKEQQNVVGAMIRDEITENDYVASPSLWTDCPGLRFVWFATAPWDSGPHRPPIFTTWTRP